MSDTGPFGDVSWNENGGGVPVSGRMALKPVGHKPKVSVAAIIVAVLLIACTIAAVVVLVKLGVLPTWALVLAVAVDAIVALGFAAMVLLSGGPKAHRGRFWVATVLSVLMMIGNLGIVKAGTDFMTFLGTDIQAPTTDTVLYDVVVLQDGPGDVADLAGSPMGIVSDDPLAQPVRDKVSSMVQVDFVESTPWSSTIAALGDGQVTSVAIQDGFMQVLSDANPDQYATLKVITSFQIDSSLATTPSASATPIATPTPVPVGNAFVVYVSGNDQPGSINARGRSDVNILMVINPDTGKVLLVNTPRDYYVQLHGTTGLKDKLTHAGVYGIDMSVGTMEDLYGITINYYIRINFSSLVKIVDTLGGVDVDSEYAFTASAGGFTFVEGMNHLNGEQALAFSRERHSFEGGDRVRGENQERVIAAIIHKLSDPAVLVNYPSILAATQGFVQTSMPQDEITAQIKSQLTTNRSWDVSAISVTGGDDLEYTYTYPGQRLYVMPPDQASLDAAKAQIASILQG